ncbi:MAG: hypothetical protein FJ038_04785 [Chloroflexi bacterium]|nr:hypothetical protein [Chloroflexota bacterium]
MAGLARTVLGDVDPSGWGVTLVHEHLVVDWGELQGKPKLRFGFEEGVGRIVERLAAARADGVGGLGECTPIGTGRYADVMVEASRRSGVAIVGATGFFHEGWTPMHPLAKALDVDALTDVYVREITEGMGATTVRAGLIKCATGEGSIPVAEEKLLRATACAHRATNAPIVAHITESMEKEQLDIFESEGVDPSAVCISHVGSGERWQERLLGALRRGANVSVDMITYDFAPDEERIGVVRVAADAGFAGQVMLAHDALVLQSGPEQMFGIGPSDFGYIPRVFVPRLIAAGVDAAAAWAMVRENAQRFLARF